MVMYKIAAKEQLRLLWIISMFANSFRMLPANPATSCGPEVYQRVILTLDYQVLTALAAAMLLLAVWVAVSVAESNAVTVTRMAVCAAECKSIAACTRAHHEAAAAAVDGVGSIMAKWCWVSLHGTLLLAMVLSTVSCLLMAVALEEWFMYRIGCDAGYGVGSPLNLFLMMFIVLVQGCFAWDAVSQN